MVLAVVVILIAALVFLITRLFGGSKEAEPQPTTSSEQQQSESSPDSPCVPADLEVKLVSGPEAVEVGSEAEFEVAVINGGAEACTVDVGAESRVLTITSGNDRIWSSQDCASEDAASRLVLLRAGSEHTDTAVWDGARSDADCSQDLPKPRPGTYQLKIEIPGAEAAEHRFKVS